MARATQRTLQVEKVRPYVEGVAQYLIDKLYGPDGPSWGTTMTEIEDLLLDIRQVLTERMLDDAPARQATAHEKAPTPARACPGCSQPLACDDTNERIVTTRAGEAQWAEPEGYCDRCRRAFFPSVQEPGHRPV
jgi:hypothetical protein